MMMGNPMRIALVALAFASTLHAADWPQWLGPQRDGVWRETGLVDTFPKDLKPLWSQSLGQGYSGPAVSDGKLFVMDRELAKDAKNPANVFDSKSKVDGNERVLCFNSKTGQPLWKHEYPCTYQISYAAGPRCTPTVDGKHVYTLGAMGDLYCLDKANGNMKWKKNLVKDYAAKVPVWGFACHPLIDGDKLIVVGGGPDKLVIAFDKLTGNELWHSQSCEGDFGYCPPVILEFGGIRQLIVWHSQACVGLDPGTGKRLWKYEFSVKAALNTPLPRKIGDHLLIVSFYQGSTLLKVGKDSVEVTWKSKAKGERPNLTTDLSSIMCTPFIDDGTIYGVCSYGELRGVDAMTGKRLWSTMKATRGALTPPKVAENEEPAESERWSNAFIVKQEQRYLLFNEQGDLIIAKMTPKGYEEVSRAHLIDPTNTMAGRRSKVVWMHPAFADKCVFVRNDDVIRCYSLAK
ncbi:PQQ-like beta-propeller repeat protein [soil metagenome]